MSDVYIPTINNTYQLQQQLNAALKDIYVGLDAAGTVTKVDTGTGLSGGPITTTGTITLADTAVTAGDYTSANISIDKQGRITKAANGSSGGVSKVDTGTGLTGGPITTTGTVTLADTAVTPGSYTSADITVDQQGRITAAANGSGASFNIDGGSASSVPAYGVIDGGGA